MIWSADRVEVRPEAAVDDGGPPGFRVGNDIADRIGVSVEEGFDFGTLRHREALFCVALKFGSYPDI